MTLHPPATREEVCSRLEADAQTASAWQGWRQKSLTPDAVARAIRYALEQPEGVDVNEVTVRPTAAGV